MCVFRGFAARVLTAFFYISPIQIWVNRAGSWRGRKKNKEPVGDGIDSSRSLNSTLAQRWKTKARVSRLCVLNHLCQQERSELQLFVCNCGQMWQAHICIYCVCHSSIFLWHEEKDQRLMTKPKELHSWLAHVSCVPSQWGTPQCNDTQTDTKMPYLGARVIKESFDIQNETRDD